MDMIERVTAAARGATDAYAAGDGLWMLEGGVRSDAFFQDIVRAVLTELREPSPEMLARAIVQTDITDEQIAAGDKAIRLLPTMGANHQREGWIAAAEMVRDWQNLIDAALEPSSPAAGR